MDELNDSMTLIVDQEIQAMGFEKMEMSCKLFLLFVFGLPWYFVNLLEIFGWVSLRRLKTDWNHLTPHQFEYLVKCAPKRRNLLKILRGDDPYRKHFFGNTNPPTAFTWSPYWRDKLPTLGYEAAKEMER